MKCALYEFSSDNKSRKCGGFIDKNTIGEYFNFGRIFPIVTKLISKQIMWGDESMANTNKHKNLQKGDTSQSLH